MRFLYIHFQSAFHFHRYSYAKNNEIHRSNSLTKKVLYPLLAPEISSKYNVCMLGKNPIIVLTGASGSGKTTVTNYLVEKYNFKRAKTCTTRAPRTEENEDSYYFMTTEEFEEKINEGQMVEYVQIFGNYYGSQVSTFEAEESLVVSLNHTGTQSLKNIYPDRVLRVLMKVSLDNMIERITKRSKIRHIELIHRLDEFEILNRMSQETICNNFDYIVNTNDSLSVVISRFDQIIGLIAAPHCCYELY